MRLIAEALADAGCDVHLVTGGMPIGGRMPRGVQTVQLPPIRVSDASFMPLRDGDYVPIDDAYRARRRDMLVATFETLAPDAVMFETFPFGRRSLRFELMPLLERIDATRPRPLVLGSVRDILQIQQKPERDREMLGWAKTWFDAILVHGDPRFARFEETFPLLHELGRTGALHRLRAGARALGWRSAKAANGRKWWCRQEEGPSASNTSRWRSRRSRSRGSAT